MLRDPGVGVGRRRAENGHRLAQADTVTRTVRLGGPAVCTLRAENWERVPSPASPPVRRLPL